LKKDVIFITTLFTPGYDPKGHLYEYFTFAYKTWEWWAKKNNVLIYILSESDISVEEMGPCWQRWYAHDILKREGIEYRRIAIIDADTMIRWDCPNFFDLYRDSYCGVTCECDHWVHKSLNQFQHYFPGINMDWENYIDNGMVLLPEESQEFCKTITDFYWENQKQLKHDEIHNYGGTDQTPVNYLATKYYGDNIKLLSRKYNMMHMNLRGVLEHFIFIESGYIWQFNGFQNKDRKIFMGDTWEKIKHHYI